MTTRSAPAIRRTGGERAPAVAVVNDFPSVIAALETRLQAHAASVRVVDAEAGAEDVGTVDVVLFDTFATRTSAVERLRTLRSHIGDTPIVVLSADMPPAFRVAMDGIDGVITVPKTVTTVQLAQMLATLGAGGHVDEVPFEPREVAASDVLGETEREVLALAMESRTTAQIAEELMRSEADVSATLSIGLRKLGLTETVQLIDAETAPSLASYRCGLRVRELHRDPGQVSVARRFVGERLRDCGADDTSVAVFRLAVSELGANVVEHGRGEPWSVCVYGSLGWWSVEVEGEVGPRPADFVHPDDWHIAPPPARSGRGLGIVRHLMDEVTVIVNAGHARVICRRRH